MIRPTPAVRMEQAASVLLREQPGEVRPQEAGDLVETSVGQSTLYQVYEKERGQLRVFAFDAAGAETGQKAVERGWPKFSLVDQQGNLLLFTSNAIQSVRPDGSEAFSLPYEVGFLACDMVGSLEPHLDSQNRAWFLNLEGRLDCVDATWGKPVTLPECLARLKLDSFGAAGSDYGLGVRYNQVYALDLKEGQVKRLPDLPFEPMNKTIKTGSVTSVQATVGSGYAGELATLPDGSITLRASVVSAERGGIAGGPTWSRRVYVLPPGARKWREKELPANQAGPSIVHPDGRVLFLRPADWQEDLPVHEVVAARPDRKSEKVLGQLVGHGRGFQLEVHPVNGNIFCRTGNTIAELTPDGEEVSSLSFLGEKRRDFGNVQLAGFLPDGQVAIGNEETSELHLYDSSQATLRSGHEVKKELLEQMQQVQDVTGGQLATGAGFLAVGGVRLKVRSS